MPISNTVTPCATGNSKVFFWLPPQYKSFLTSYVFLSICLVFFNTAFHSNKAYSASTNAGIAEQPSRASGIKRKIPNPLYGITIDTVDPLNTIIDSISSLPKRMTTRVVFDEWEPAEEYTEALEALHPKSYIMGEILDSYYVKDYSIAEYRSRVKEYLDAHGDKVDIWEIGNEVNGEWLGNPDHVATKIEDAYRQVKARNYKTALTLYYNKDCWAHSWEEMFRWAKTRLSNNLRSGLDYVLVSYYEGDCNNLRPDWQSVFDKLGQLFPNSKLAFGEIGTSNPRKKAQYLKRYYTMKIHHPRYVGGHFWWYYIQDMVPKTKPLWSTLETILKETDNNSCDAEPYTLLSNNWRLIGLPCQPPTHADTVTDVFGNNDIGDYGTDWLVYRYDTDLNKYIALNVHDPVGQGIGYWIIQITGKTVSLSMPIDSTPTPVIQSDSCSTPQGCFEISLATQTNTTQWNMLGNPFGGDSTLNGIRVTTHDISTNASCGQANGCTLKEAEANRLVHSNLWHYVDHKTGYITLKKDDPTTSWDGFWTAAMENADENSLSLLFPINDKLN